ncbi:MAG: methionine--tRNA ligase subunit beta, partial [Deltaproteobacteria bacterium]|nr:methionine--tRNA ligase subunit beta [Deltaproteobacteria bacterium]
QEILALPRSGRELALKDIREWGKESPVRALSKAPQLFPRIDTNKKEKAVKQSDGEEKEEVKELISFQDFQRLDLRIGTIKKAESIPKAKKLIKLIVDMGEERTVVAGIAGHYSVDDLVGRQVVLLANLEPIKLMGVKSVGMVLAAEDGSGVHLLAPDVNTLPGSRVK